VFTPRRECGHTVMIVEFCLSIGAVEADKTPQ
jgi:hypothetical protein